MMFIQKRWYLNLGLVLIVIGLIALVRGLPQSNTTKKPLVTVPREDIQRIQITQANAAEQILLVKQTNAWYMQQPKLALVNPIRMAQLLTITDEAIEADYPSAGKDLVAFGLVLPHVTLKINEQVFEFGNLNPVSKQRYILSKGRLNLVSEGVDNLLMGNALDWIDLQLVPENVPIKTITLPMGYRQTPELKQNWQSATAVRVEKCTGQEPQHGTITLELLNGQALHYQRLDSQSDELVLCNVASGLRYILPKQQQKNLLIE